MSKEYKLTVSNRTAQPRSKRLKALGLGDGATIQVYNTYSGGGGEGGGGGGGDGHTHQNKKDLDRITTDFNRYIYLDGQKAKTGFADTAHDLSPEGAAKYLSAVEDDKAAGKIGFEKGISIKGKDVNAIRKSTDTDAAVPVADNNVPTTKYVDSNFISSVHDDRAKGKIIMEKGAEFGTFNPGLVGSGGRIDENGRGEMRSLRLWESLEVPELRYNRVSVYIGIRMDTFGGGIIESVTPDETLDGIGSATLKLEDGEFGAVDVDDLMMGIWHDTGGNETKTEDDHLGKFSFAGFKTVYFQITEVSGDRNEQIRYMLRSKADGGNGVHPFVGMHFAARGNIDEKKEDRHAFVYSTTQYSVSLTGVMGWNFLPEHYYEIHGNLEGFKMPAINEEGDTYMKEFHGHGVVFGNAYIFGEIDAFKRQGYKCVVNQSLNGMLMPGDTEQVYVQVFDGGVIDVTEQFSLVSVTRNSGDSASDAYWNAQPERQQSTNPFTISFSDLGIDGIRQVVAVFEVSLSTVDGDNVKGKLDFY